MAITFDVSAKGGVFRYSDEYDGVVDELDAALDLRDAGQLSLQSYTATLKKLVVRYPEFIDGHAHLGYALLELGRPKVALEACLRGVSVGENAIPEDFRGQIEWGHYDNRPFLRAAHGAVLCYLRLGKRQSALALMEKMLAWNPDDNQGVRYVIGSEFSRAGQTEKARAVFEAEAAQYPPYHYELALLQFRDGNRVAAATSLRHGFAANGYIAEMLCGNPEPLPLAIWHGTNFAGSGLAQEYISLHADIWRHTPNAIAFVRWLYNHPKVLFERASILECQEELLWEHDFDRRRLIVERMDLALQQLDDRLSKQIVRERQDRHGRGVLPWLYSAAK